MDAKSTIGRFIRGLREKKGLTQEQLASKAGITYQYLSGLENGRENFSIDILESLSRGLSLLLPQLVAGAYDSGASFPAPELRLENFKPKTPLPAGMRLSHLEAAMRATTMLIARINRDLRVSGGKPLPEYIQGNNFSGLVSNVLCDALHDHSPFKHNSHQASPDLINSLEKAGGTPEGLEVKATIQVGKGGESHNGHGGWHLVACFQIEESTGDIRFIHVMMARLNSHITKDPDWTYLGSKQNRTTGSRRTETYITTLEGTTKLRDGTVYLDPGSVDFRRWRQKRRGAVPDFSIFAATPPGAGPGKGHGQ